MNGIYDKFKSFLHKHTFLYKIFLNVLWIKGFFGYFNLLGKDIIKFKNQHKKPVFLVFTPEHGNLGDHAIALAEEKLLKAIGIDFFEITGEQLRLLQHFKMLSLLNRSLILVNGGGNLGSLWPFFEDLTRQLFLSNKKADIFILPNTIYYGESSDDREYFEESVRIYNSHKSLKIYTRERYSYNLVKDYYNDVTLVPDMVLSLDYSKDHGIRDGCILCLRNDSEKILSDEQLQIINSFARNNFDKIISADNVLECSVMVCDRAKALDERFNLFKSAELVITDRLHGMIFCAVTGTPCIVVASKSHKLSGCYEWIKELDYIQFIDSVNDIESLFASIPKLDYEFNNHHLLPYFEQLKSDIENVLK